MNENLATSAPERTGKVRTLASSTRSTRRNRPESKLRTKVAAAFRKLGNGVDRKTAYERTKAWYRLSGSDWARCLS